MVISAAVLLISVLFAGCGTSAEDRIRDDAIQYSSSLALLAVLEIEAGDLFKSVIGDNYTDNETLRAMLLGQVMPTYHEFVDGLESITPSTEEITEIHEKLIGGGQ